MTIEQIIRTVVVLTIVGAPVIKGIASAMRRQAERRRELQALEQAHAEALRTGRVEASPPMIPQTMPPVQVGPATAARSELEMMAAQRRAQIEAMRARRQAPPTQQVPRRVETAPMPMPSAPPPQPVQRQGPTKGDRKRQREQARREAEAQAARDEAAEAARREAEAKNRRRAQTAAEAAAPKTTSGERRRRPISIITGGDASRVRWRQAMILREVLGPPASMREPGGSYG